MWKPHKSIRASLSSCSGLIRLCALPVGRQGSAAKMERTAMTGKEISSLRNSSDSSIGCVGQRGTPDTLLAGLASHSQLDCCSCRHASLELYWLDSDTVSSYSSTCCCSYTVWVSDCSLGNAWSNMAVYGGMLSFPYMGLPLRTDRRLCMKQEIRYFWSEMLI